MRDKKGTHRLALVSWVPSPSLRSCISDRLGINSATRRKQMISTCSQEASDSMLGTITAYKHELCDHHIPYAERGYQTAHVAIIEDR
jgi:hypothetical protein